MKKEDIIEIIIEELKKIGYNTKSKDSKNSNNADKTDSSKVGFFVKEKYIKSYSSLPKGKKLITEYEIKQYLKLNPGKKEIVIPEKAIISPLAEDFINSSQLKVIREKKY